jgi:hypothetical protein
MNKKYFCAVLCFLLSASLCAADVAEAQPPSEPLTPPTVTTETTELTLPTDAEIAQINWREFNLDNAWENPFAHDFSSITDFEEREIEWDKFIERLNTWPPGQVQHTEQRVRNLMCAAVLEDIGQGMFEAELPLYLYTTFRREVPDNTLKKIWLIMAFHPQHSGVIETAPELNMNIGLGENAVRERLQILAVKMLGRMLGKLPIPE